MAGDEVGEDAFAVGGGEGERGEGEGVGEVGFDVCESDLERKTRVPFGESGLALSVGEVRGLTLGSLDAAGSGGGGVNVLWSGDAL